MKVASFGYWEYMRTSFPLKDGHLTCDQLDKVETAVYKTSGPHHDVCAACISVPFSGAQQGI
jgi:hypothetical protein